MLANEGVSVYLSGLSYSICLTSLTLSFLCLKCPLAQSQCVCDKGERGPSGPAVSIYFCNSNCIVLFL